jgi:hypothetical protein
MDFSWFLYEVEIDTLNRRILVKVYANSQCPKKKLRIQVDTRKKFIYNGKEEMETVDTQGGCCGSSFWSMFCIVTCCCNQKMADNFVKEDVKRVG